MAGGFLALPKEFENIGDFSLDAAGDLHDIKNNSAAARNGLTDWQRIIANSIYDTQPTRRKQYFKELGFDTKQGGNFVRPLNLDGTPDTDEPWQIVDPGLNAYTKKGALKEFGLDIVEGLVEVPGIVIDSMAAAAGTAVGAAGGLALGTAAGGAIGGAPTGGALAAPAAIAGGVIGAGTGAVGGGAVGAGLGIALTEEIKKGIGDFFFTETDLPMDRKLQTFQAILGGMMGKFGELGGNAFNAWRKSRAEGVTDVLTDALVKSSNRNLTVSQVKKMVEKPQNHTKEAIANTQDRFRDIRNEIFGTSVEKPFSTRQMDSKSAGGKAIAPLNKQADLEIERLSHDRNADVSLEELENAMNLNGLAELRAKGDRAKFGQQAAVKFIDAELDRERKTLAKGKKIELFDAEDNLLDTPQEIRKLDFGETRDLVKKMQGAVFDAKDKSNLRGNAALTSLVGSLKGDLDGKARALGSTLPDINAKRSEILKAHEVWTTVINDNAMEKSFIGKPSLRKSRAIEQMERMDSILHTDFTERLQDTQTQAVMAEILDNPKGFEPGSFVQSLKSGMKSAVPIAFKGSIITRAAGGKGSTGIKLGAGAGFATGFSKQRRLANPDKVIQDISNKQNTIDAIAARNKGFLGGPGIMAKAPRTTSGIAAESANELPGAEGLQEEFMSRFQGQPPQEEELTDEELLQGFEGLEFNLNP